MGLGSTTGHHAPDEMGKVLGPGFEVGHSFFCPPADSTESLDWEAWYRFVVEWEIGPLLREYWFDDMPRLYKDAFMRINHDSTKLHAMHDKDRQRMLDFKDWPTADIQSIKAFVKELKPSYQPCPDRLKFLEEPEAGHAVTDRMWNEGTQWLIRHLVEQPIRSAR